jgi:hypothetical protein
VAFFPMERVDFVADPLDLEPARRATGPPRLRLNARVPRPRGVGEPAVGRPALRTRRPSGDRIQVDLTVPVPGYLRLLESWSAGWSARVDGQPAAVLPGDGFTMAVPVEAGNHRVELRYATPGRRIGGLFSGLAALALAGIVAGARRSPRRRGGPPGSAASSLDGPSG